MPQICGIESLFPSETLYPADDLAPGSGKIFVPTLPLNPADFPIDDSAAVFVASNEVVSLGRFYPARFFNDLPEYFQGLPFDRMVGTDPLPEYENEPDSPEARKWGVQRILLRAIGREMARFDYVLRGRVSLADYLQTRSLPHATPPDDLNLFELEIYGDDPAFIQAPASFVDPSTVWFREEEYRTNRAPVRVEGTSQPAGLYYIFAHRINDQHTMEFLGVTGGLFTLSMRGETTQPLPSTASAAAVQAQIEAFSFVSPGDILVTKPGADTWRFQWRGEWSGTDMEEFTVDASALTGAPEVVQVTEVEGDAGFELAMSPSDVEPDASYVLIGDASWTGTEFTAVATYPRRIGSLANGKAFYNPFTDPMANNDVNPACTPLSQNEGLAPQMFAVTANWALDLWENMLGLEVPSKNPVNLTQYPERRARILRALLSTRASTAAEYSYLAAQRARELGIVLGEFEEAEYTDPNWDDEEYVVTALDEVAFYQLNNTTGGTYQLSLDNVNWTAPISVFATAVQVEAALELLPGVNPDDIYVYSSDPTGAIPGTAPGRYFLSYSGVVGDSSSQFSGQDRPRIFVDQTNLVGIAPGALMTTVQNGTGALNEVQKLTLSDVTAGLLRLQFDGLWTDWFSYAATESEVKGVLTKLFNVGPNDVIVTAMPGREYTFEFTENLGQLDLPLMLVDGSLLDGVPANVSQGIDGVDILEGQIWRGYTAMTSYDNYPLHGAPAESTFPWWIWASVYDVEGLDEDPLGAKVRIATLRKYIQTMTPAHLQVGFDWGPMGGFLVDISLVGIDRV